MDKLNQAEVAARAADRARVLREDADAKATSAEVKFVFLERGGAASADAAALKAKDFRTRSIEKVEESN